MVNNTFNSSPSPIYASTPNKLFFNTDLADSVRNNISSTKTEGKEKPNRKFILAKDLQSYESDRQAKQQEIKYQSQSYQQQSQASNSQQLQPLGINLVQSSRLSQMVNAQSTMTTKSLSLSASTMASPTASFKNSQQISFQQSKQSANQGELGTINTNTKTSGDLLEKEKNIFATGLNKINPQLYKEFNIGPRTDTNGKIVQYTLVGNPQWFSKQRDLLEKQQNKAKGQQPFSYVNRESFARLDEESSNNKGKPKKNAISSNSSHSGKQMGMPSSERSIGSLRLDTAQSVNFGKPLNMNVSTHMTPSVHQSQVRKKKRNESNIEVVSKEDVLKEFATIEKRHEEVNKAEKRTLNSMSLDMRNGFTRDERVLQKFHEHLDDWDTQISHVTKISERQPITSCMLRGEEHRRKLELMQAYDNLKTEEERFGKRIWYMYLRKYEREKNPNLSESEDFTSGRNIKQSGTESTFSATKTSTQGSDWKNASKPKEKVKRRDLIDANENTQSDIFSGFMTVAIHNNNKQIEVIRKTQDPIEYHLSSSSSVPVIRKAGKSFQMENVIKDASNKLKNKMIVLEQPIDDFVVIGVNKLASEKNAALKNKSPYFSKLLSVNENEQDGIVNPQVNTAQQQQSYLIQRQSSKQQLSRTPSQQVIEIDYNMNELSRTGQHFFPQIADKLSTASNLKSQRQKA